MNLNSELSLSFKKKEKGPKLEFGAPPMANLIPPRSREVLERRTLQRTWTAVVAVTAVAMAIVVFVGFTLKEGSKHNYNKTVADQSSINKQLAQYKDVSDAISASKLLDGKRTLAMKSELKWGDVIGQIQAALPPGVVLESFTGQGGGDPASTTSVSLAMVITISSTTAIDYADVLKIFSQIKNLSDLQIGDLTSSSGTDDKGNAIATYTYTIAFGFGQDAYTKQYTTIPASDAAIANAAVQK